MIRHAGAVAIVLLALTGASQAATAIADGPRVGAVTAGSMAALFPTGNAGERLAVDGIALPERDLRDLYERVGHEALWTGDAEARERARQVLAVLRAADREGLLPQDYFVEALTARLDDPAHVADGATDLLVSAAVMRYGADLQGARLSPRRLSEVLDYDDAAIDRVRIAADAADAEDVVAYLDGLAPPRLAYDDLRRALAAQRAVVAAGGWPTVPEGPTLRPGEESERIPALRARLIASGDLAAPDDPAAMDDPLYDEALEGAARRFQDRHGLTVDGLIGPMSYAALNVSAQARLDQIVATMERWRWLPRDLGDRHIMVNLAGYELEVRERGRLVRRMDVVVGRPTRETPLFSSALTWLEFNPTWTIPTSIAQRDMLPGLQQDPYYLVNQNIRTYSSWQPGAMEMQSQYMDWHNIGRGIRHYMLRQDPGPGNSLGKVKFMMANNFSVYLHDTPSRYLFARDRRAYSSGCVRVQDPIWLADYLLEGHSSWTETARASVLGHWTPTRYNLPRTMPLHLAYHTAWIDDQGRLQFREDVYGLDTLVIDALDSQQPRTRLLALADQE